LQSVVALFGLFSREKSPEFKLCHSRRSNVIRFLFESGHMHYLIDKEEMQDEYNTKTMGGLCRARRMPDTHGF
jgi:hypothetical protein